jgi:hypothetical protein
MCGIVGIIRMDGKDVSDTAMEFFEKLLYHDTIRGPHSTGVFSFDNQQKVAVRKAAQPGPEFLNSDRWRALEARRKKVGTRAIFGHNRWATVGEVTDQNAHPFLHEKIILMHNGTLHNKDQLNKELDVDSSALCHAINKDGWQKAINTASGSWALSWFDLKEVSINILRNSQRPLSISRATIDGVTYHIFASEKNMLGWLIDRTFSVHATGISDVSTDTLFKYKWTKEGWKITSEQHEPEWKRNQRRYSRGVGFGMGLDDDLPYPHVSDIMAGRHKAVVPVNQKSNGHKSYHGPSIHQPGLWNEIIGTTIFFVWLNYDVYNSRVAEQHRRGKVEGLQLTLNNGPVNPKFVDYDVVKYNITEEESKRIVDDRTVFSGRVVRLGTNSHKNKCLVVEEVEECLTHEYDSKNDCVIRKFRNPQTKKEDVIDAEVIAVTSRGLAKLPEPEKDTDGDFLQCTGCKQPIPREQHRRALNYDTLAVYCDPCAKKNNAVSRLPEDKSVQDFDEEYDMLNSIYGHVHGMME